MFTTMGQQPGSAAGTSLPRSRLPSGFCVGAGPLPRARWPEVCRNLLAKR